MDPAEYKHVVLGLLFLKYLEDAFQERREDVRAATADPASDFYVPDEAQRKELLPSLLERRDIYTAANVYWVPEKARWSYIQVRAEETTIGKALDEASDLIGKENRSLHGVLPTLFARPTLDQYNLRKLFEVVREVGFGLEENGDGSTLGRVYECFLSRFASAEGGRGGAEWHTPGSVVQLMVEMLRPGTGRVYDPCCGAGGMFAQTARFAKEHGGTSGDVTFYGQESNHDIWSLARMNLTVLGLDADLGTMPADTLRHDLHPHLRADYAFAVPPFNLSLWSGDALPDDPRWVYGKPPKSNANFAWLQHVIARLEVSGTAAVAMTNNSLSSVREAEIRRKIIEADLVECIVACPGELFQTTAIPVSIWFLSKDKASGNHRDRRGETLFIDARKLGRMKSRSRRVLDGADIARVVDTFTSWRADDGGYNDESGFCRSSDLAEIEAKDFVLTPAIYVGPDYAEQTRIEAVAVELEVVVRNGATANLVARDAHIRDRICKELIGRIPDLNLVRIDAAKRDWTTLRHLRNLSVHGGASAQQTVLLLENWTPHTVRDRPEEWALLIAPLHASPAIGTVVMTNERIALLQGDARQSPFPGTVLSATRVVDADKHLSLQLCSLFGAANGTSASSGEVTSAERERMMRVLDVLPEKERTVLILKGIEKLSVAEVAEVLNLSETTVVERLEAAHASFSRIHAEEVFREFGDGDASLAQFAEAPAWERFLSQLVLQHKWLGEELNALGFEFGAGTPFASFLLRQGLRPAQFAAMLFRPSDMKKVFGAFDASAGVERQLEDELRRLSKGGADE